jgi:hypothetical protein
MLSSGDWCLMGDNFRLIWRLCEKNLGTFYESKERIILSYQQRRDGGNCLLTKLCNAVLCRVLQVERLVVIIIKCGNLLTGQFGPCLGLSLTVQIKNGINSTAECKRT